MELANDDISPGFDIFVNGAYFMSANGIQPVIYAHAMVQQLSWCDEEGNLLDTRYSHSFFQTTASGYVEYHIHIGAHEHEAGEYDLPNFSSAVEDDESITKLFETANLHEEFGIPPIDDTESEEDNGDQA